MKRIDHTGKKYGFLTAVRKSRRRQVTGRLWEFLCDCGTICYRLPSGLAHQVRDGYQPSCGCRRTAKSGQALTPGNVVKVGERFGLLVVTKASHKDGYRYFHCRCDCGNRTVVRAALLRFGQTRSCGHLSGRVKPKNFMPIARFAVTAVANDDAADKVGVG